VVAHTCVLPETKAKMAMALSRRGLPSLAGFATRTLRTSALSHIAPAVRPVTAVFPTFTRDDLKTANQAPFLGFAASGVRGYSTEVSTHIPATTVALKTPTGDIGYDSSSHDRYAPGSPSKKAFTYFVLTGGRFIYASAIRLVVLRFILSMTATADVLALASVEVDIGAVAEGSTVTIKWRGKPVFIRHRTESEVADAAGVDVASLRDPQTDAERAVNPKWLVTLGVCTHLGCVPLPNAGDYGGWFCPCHGSHYDVSGRIRKGPAPYNLEVPEYKFIEEDKLLIG